MNHVYQLMNDHTKKLPNFTWSYPTRSRKPWMTKEILDMIVTRNKLRTKDYTEYKKVKNEVTTKCREAKEKWLEENIKEIEADILVNNTSKAYNKVKNFEYKPKTRSNIVRDKDGKILFENNKVAERWKEYMEDLYRGEEIEDEEDYIESELNVHEDSKGPEILWSEFNKALSDLTDKKATGIDNIPAELLKNIDDKTKSQLFEFTKDCYINGKLPNDFVKSKTITLPKKGNASDCGNYRTIALLSHTSKILLNIIKNRLKNKVEQNLDEDQFGFRKGKGTREAILTVNQILERRLELDKDTYATFIDLEKHSTK